jgi:hypothetical protein
MNRERMLSTLNDVTLDHIITTKNLLRRCFRLVLVNRFIPIKPRTSYITHISPVEKGKTEDHDHLLRRKKNIARVLAGIKLKSADYSADQVAFEVVRGLP